MHKPGIRPESGGEAGRERRAIARLKGGDIGALHYLYARYANEVHGLVQSMIHDHHAAEDVTQLVFTKLVHAINRYEQRDVPFAAWITRVARNAALDHLRSRRQVPVEEVRGADAGTDLIALERLRALREALMHLPEDQRSVIAMRHIAGMSPNEIAVRLHRSEPSVHGLHHRGRTALKEILSDMDVAPTTAA